MLQKEKQDKYDSIVSLTLDSRSSLFDNDDDRDHCPLPVELNERERRRRRLEVFSSIIGDGLRSPDCLFFCFNKSPNDPFFGGPAGTL